MKPPALLAVAAGLLSGAAHASAFETKTMRDPLPAREVERPLNMPKGWLEFSPGFDLKNSTGYWDADGNAVDWQTTSWLYSTEYLAVRYGVTRRSELFWTFNTHYVALTNTERGTDIHTYGMGDPTFGWALDLYRHDSPLSSAQLYLKYKAPAGNESPGNYSGQANSFSSVVMTTGTPDIWVGLRGKQQVGPAALTLGAAYVERVSNTVQYLVETEQGQFNARIKPGNQVRVNGDLLVQLGPVAPHVEGELVMRGLTKVGQTSPGFFGDRNLVAVDDSDGWSLDLTPGLVLNLTRGVDVDLAATIPLRGEDLQFFPIEDLEPTRGLTIHGAVELRY